MAFIGPPVVYGTMLVFLFFNNYKTDNAIVTRQEMEIQNKVKLKHYIIDEDLWNRSTIETEGFEKRRVEIKGEKPYHRCSWPRSDDRHRP